MQKVRWDKAYANLNLKKIWFPKSSINPEKPESENPKSTRINVADSKKTETKLVRQGVCHKIKITPTKPQSNLTEKNLDQLPNSKDVNRSQSSPITDPPEIIEKPQSTKKHESIVEDQ